MCAQAVEQLSPPPARKYCGPGGIGGGEGDEGGGMGGGVGGGEGHGAGSAMATDHIPGTPSHVANVVFRQTSACPSHVWQYSLYSQLLNGAALE